MESNKNDNNNGIDNKHEQPQRTAPKRKLNQLTNDEEPTEAAGEEDQNSTNSKKKKNCEEGNDMDLELQNLSREELIKLVQKQMQILNQNDETIKQLEATKKEAEESANRQAEEFSLRIVELEHEKEELHADLHQKMAEIVNMHKEVEKKSEELTEKAKQIDALLTQLNESTSHQHQMPTEQEMKIQLSLETWYDWLGFVPRQRLGKIVPKIGDRRFASIVQKFLHEYGEITINSIEIIAPYEGDSSGPQPQVRVWKNCRQFTFEMAQTQMPANIKNCDCFELSYFDRSVPNFMQKFQQNGLFENVNLLFGELPSKAIVQPILCHLLPLIKDINSIYVKDSARLVDFYDAGNSKEIYELNMKMMEETRFLGVIYDYENLHPTKIDLYCRWLYQTQTARADGKPRVLQFSVNKNCASISLFIDRIKKDFLKATDSVSCFIRIILPKSFQPQEDICLDNYKTKERLQTKMEEEKWEVGLLISRYPLTSTKKWIEENEKVLAWNFNVLNEKTIYLSDKLKMVRI